MENVWLGMGSIFSGTLRDVAPIVALLLFFQYIVLRRPIRNLRKTVEGFVFVVLGLALFLARRFMDLISLVAIWR